MKKEIIKNTKDNADIEASAENNEKEILVNEDKVGSMIHDARMKKGIKIADASKELCIRKSYLEAIEAGNYEEIPEPPYGLGFIRSYAEYLGLNSARMVQLFKEETDANSKHYNNDYYVMEPQSEVTAPNKKYLMISLLAIFLVYFIWFMFNEKQNQDANLPVEEEYSETVNEQANFPLQVEDFASIEESVDGAITPEAIPVVDAAPIPDGVEGNVKVDDGSFVEPVVAPVVEAPKVESQVNVKAETKKEVKADSKASSRIVIKIKGGDNWVSVKDAQKLYISKVLRDGEVYKIPEGKGMILSVGRFEGVEVTVDGKVTQVVTANKKTNVELDTFLDSANH